MGVYAVRFLPKLKEWETIRLQNNPKVPPGLSFKNIFLLLKDVGIDHVRG